MAFSGVPPDITRFCGFNLNGSDFRAKYLFDERTLTLTPCAEFAIVSCQNLPFLFYIVVNLSLITRHFARLPSRHLWRLLCLKTCISVLTATCASIMIVTGYFSYYRVKTVVLLEYGLVVLVWLMAAIIWGVSAHLGFWTRTTALTLSEALASKSFLPIILNRWMMFGFADLRTLFPFVLLIAHIALSVVHIVEWRIKKHYDQQANAGDDYVRLDPEGDESASMFSKLFFCWTNPLVRKGARYQLNELDDVFHLPPSLQVATIESDMVANSPTLYADAAAYSLKSSLLATFGVRYFSLAILRLLGDAAAFAGPVLLHSLVDTLEDPAPTSDSFVYALLMMVACFASALLSAHYNFYVQKISLQIRAATVTAIYDKLLRVPLVETSSLSSGQILNFVSTDVDRIVNFCNSFHAFWSLPVQLIFALYLLHREVGPSFMAGLGAAVLLIPINKMITSRIGILSEKMMSAKDQRVKLVSEVMQGIRTVKLCAWEQFFEAKIKELRQTELKYLRGRKYLDALCVYLWASAPLLITIAIIATYTCVFHEKLTAAKVFTALALVNILIMPLNAFPWVLNGLIEAVVSLKRLEYFFAMKEFDLVSFYQLVAPNQLISLNKACFSWKNDVHVSNVSFEGTQGMVIGVHGDVGTGKSTLLLGLLGETALDSGTISIGQSTVDKGMAYVSQQHWLVRGTIRENILCGKEYDPILYEQVIAACCLQKDINNMPGGDQYRISDNGSTLSGGQRARLSLARAIYQDTNIYLLDDPFASLDKSVAATIWYEAVEKMLKNRGKLVIVACHNLRLLRKADSVLVLNNTGEVIRSGIPAKVLENAHSTPNVEAQMEISEKSKDELQEIEFVNEQEEDKLIGHVKASVYKTYAEATGFVLAASIIVALFAMQTSKNFADVWLAQWTSWAANSTLPSERHSHALLEGDDMNRSVYFLTVYACIAAANTMFTLVRAFLFAYGGVVAARELHESLLLKLLSAPLSWWDKTPAGRVINRACADVYTADDNLPFQLNILLASFFNLLGTLIVTLIGLPILIPVVLVLLVVYFFTQRYYRRTTVELKRLSSLALSPFYSHLSDSVNGLATIRAHRLAPTMLTAMRAKLTSSLRAQYSSLAAGQWLSIRLSFIAVTVVSAVALGAIFQHRLHPVESGLVGLAITYALSLTGLLNGLLGSFIETEKEMVSVERIDEYIEHVPSEEKSQENPFLTSSTIEFNTVCLRYGRGLPLALDHVEFKINQGERVAITGRTGSGKSSLLIALLRGVPIEKGVIKVGGVDVCEFGLHHLRHTFGLVSQHPFLFSGTLWENLTISVKGMADRKMVQRLLQKAGLESLLERILGLNGEIAEAGNNLSHGEKQIIALCRVIIQNPMIVLIDEATAHLDKNSHERMISLIKSELPRATILSIVHNVSGLHAYDRMITMENGGVKWIGSTLHNSSLNTTTTA